MVNKSNISQSEALVLANSNTTLGAGGVFTGSIFRVSGYTNITGFVYSNVGSATNGLVVEQAADSADFASGYVTRTRLTYTAADVDYNSFVIEVTAPFVRIRYTNGGSAQATFRIWAVAKASKG